MTKGQAKLLVDSKIRGFATEFPNLGNEIKEIKVNSFDAKVIFKNESTITCVTPSDNSRGFRGNVLIVDEFRMVKKEIIDSVLRKFLSANRRPKFLSKPEYDGYPMDKFEPNKQIYMSSAWYRNHWSWDKFASVSSDMLSEDKDGNRKKYCAISLPYTVPLYHGILPLSQVETEMEESDFSQVKWTMEMEGIFWGESENAFFKFDDIDRCMRNTVCFYPDKNIKPKNKKNDFSMKDKEDGEIRILSVDVATMSGGDNTVMVCIKLIPTRYGKSGNEKYFYKKEVCYINHINGMHSELQAIQVKRLKENFNADYVVCDTMGSSISLYEFLVKSTFDKEKSIEYPAWTAFNDDRMDERKQEEDALPIIYSVKADAQMNHEMANFLKNDLSTNRISLLLSRDDAGGELSDIVDGYDKLSALEKEQLLDPFTETSLLMIELTNLDAKYNDKGQVSIVKPPSGKVKKDRYSALAYGIWYANQLEKERLNKSKKTKSSWGDMLFFN